MHSTLLKCYVSDTDLNVIGNQPAIPGHCNGKLVISTGWLAGHEVQFKDATENEEKENNTVNVQPKPGNEKSPVGNPVK